MEIRNRARREQEAADQHPDDIPPPEIIRRSTRTSPVKVATSPPVEATDSAASPETQSPITYSTSPQAIASSLENVSQASQPSSPPPYSSPEILQAPAEPEAGATSPVSNRSPDSGGLKTAAVSSQPPRKKSSRLAADRGDCAFAQCACRGRDACPRRRGYARGVQPSLLASPFTSATMLLAFAPFKHLRVRHDLGYRVCQVGQVAKTPVTARSRHHHLRRPAGTRLRHGLRCPAPRLTRTASPSCARPLRWFGRRRRLAGVCIVGRVEADLLASEGPVPIAFVLGAPGPS